MKCVDMALRLVRPEVCRHEKRDKYEMFTLDLKKPTDETKHSWWRGEK